MIIGHSYFKKSFRRVTFVWTSDLFESYSYSFKIIEVALNHLHGPFLREWDQFYLMFTTPGEKLHAYVCNYSSIPLKLIYRVRHNYGNTHFIIVLNKKNSLIWEFLEYANGHNYTLQISTFIQFFLLCI